VNNELPLMGDSEAGYVVGIELNPLFTWGWCGRVGRYHGDALGVIGTGVALAQRRSRWSYHKVPLAESGITRDRRSFMNLKAAGLILEVGCAS
jgi:hypothetical protein